MKALSFMLLAIGVLACGGEKKDELGPYIQKLNEVDAQYVKKLFAYRDYLKTPEFSKAGDIEQVMQQFHDELANYPEIDDKKIKAMNNELQRTIKGSMRKLVEPDFPTFVPNAQSAIRMVLEELVVVHNNMEKLWGESGKTEPFPLKWNFEDIE